MHGHIVNEFYVCLPNLILFSLVYWSISQIRRHNFNVFFFSNVDGFINFRTKHYISIFIRLRICTYVIYYIHTFFLRKTGKRVAFCLYLLIMIKIGIGAWLVLSGIKTCFSCYKLYIRNQEIQIKKIKNKNYFININV